MKSTHSATQQHEGDQQLRAFALLGLTYQAATVLLTKLGEADLAWIAAERGFHAAQRSGDAVVIGSLFRSVMHALLSTGRYREAKNLTQDAAAYLQPGLQNPTPQYLSIYGTLFLTGALTDDQLAGIQFADGEIAEYVYATREDIDRLTVPRLAQRLRATLDAVQTHRTTYLEMGRPAVG